MLSLEGYEIGEQIHRGRHSHVFHARHHKTRQSVIIKVSAAARATPEDLDRYRHEFEIARGIEDPHVLRYHALEVSEERPILIEEDFEGKPLREIVPTSGLDLQTFFTIALQLTDGLTAIHAHDVIHGAVYPQNILVHPETHTAKFIDFSRSSQFPMDSSDYPLWFDGTLDFLPYMSPEQTGRMNRGVDHRSDFYSLGATLYYMLCGAPPFADSDPLALVHCHIAKHPISPSDRAPHVPRALAEIILKLLAKNPEDRYRAARGLRADLETCLAKFRNDALPSTFELGQYDIPDRLLAPQKLYGRETSVETLLAAFNATRAGAKEFVLVTGYAGIGKSALVEEARKSIVEQGAYFISGKFDQLQKGVPYAAIAQAFTQFVQQLMTEHDDRFAEFRKQLIAELGPNARVLIDVIPALEKIVGTQQKLAEASLLEGQDRFQFAFSQLMRVCARHEHPLVLFLDDLQWVDAATLRLLLALSAADTPHYLLLIGAFRDNEVGPDHPLSAALSQLASSSTNVHTLALGGLSLSDLTRLVADAMGGSESSLRDLPRLIMDKTAGNPFFVNELLALLRQEKLLVFSDSERRWRWDAERIEELGLSENVVELLIRKLRKLPSETQRIVELAACVGSRFTVANLTTVSEVSRRDTIRALSAAVREGILTPVNATAAPTGEETKTWTNAYENLIMGFRHDRVQQAASELVPAERRAELHLRIARMLLRKSSAGREKRVFEIADHLNWAERIMTDPEERLLGAELNLNAGHKARAATAYDDALRYFQSGIVFLPDAAWKHQYALTHALEVGRAEAEYLSGDFDRAERSFEAILRHTLTRVESAEIYRLRMLLETCRGRHNEAFAFGKRALDLINIPIDDAPTARRVRFDAMLTRLRLRGRTAEDLLTLPEMSSRADAIAITILSGLLVPASFLSRELFFSVAMRGLLLTLSRGKTPYAAVIYQAYGQTIAELRHDFLAAYGFGRAALTLAENEASSEIRGRLHYFFGRTLAHLAEHGKVSLEYLRRALRLCSEVGDFLYASHAASKLPATLLLLGEPLSDVLRESEEAQRFIEYHGDPALLLELLPTHQLALNLRGESPEDCDLSSSELSETELVERLQKTHHRAAREAYLLTKLQLFVLFGRYDEAVALLLESGDTLSAIEGTSLQVPEHHFYAALAFAGMLRSPVARKQRPMLLEALRTCARELERFARILPHNVGHKWLLVQAELEDLAGHSDSAWKFYEEAISSAREAAYAQNLALACELCGRFFLRADKRLVAQGYLQEAHSAFTTFGATRKTAQLERDFTWLFPRPALPEPGRPTLDALSVIKACQPISSEINRDKLLERMMAIMLENAGADRGALAIASESDDLLVEAVATAGGKRITILPGTPIDGSSYLSAGIARYVFRTCNALVLNDASRHGAFTADAFVKQYQARSILCMPVRHQDRTIGVLFLENRLATRAFTEERVELLRILVAQAAISLLNARLYDATRKLNISLQEENRERMRAEEALRVSEQRLFKFLEELPLGVVALKQDGETYLANRMAREVLGSGIMPGTETTRLRQREYGAYFSGTSRPYPPERLPHIRALSGETITVEDFDIRTDKRTIPLSVWSAPIFGEDGSVEYAIAAFQDISERRRAETERARLEEQLRQAQKLESVGRLAGGVAHDFNNLLVPIIGYTDMVLARLAPDSAISAPLKEVRRAADRAADLTRQLLAFGRKQVLEVRVIDLNSEVREFEKILSRLIREDIVMDWKLAKDLGHVRADATQIQQVIMNLVINSGDAMPNGGKLIIETANVELDEAYARDHADVQPGSFVELSVSDTGYGIEPAQIPHIFEPFFTTKAHGKGTGLGLATVYGIVKQHGGHITVYSEVGRGTIFRLYFPRVDAPLNKVVKDAPLPELSAERTKILVVEDDERVRTLLASALSARGYQVMVAASPREALRMAADTAAAGIGLLVTDVVMPELNGPELYQKLAALTPNLKVLYISGYTDEAIAERGMLDPGVNFFQKPFTLQALNRKIYEILTR